MVWFTLPIAYDQGTEDIFDTITHFSFGTVTDELVHGSPFTDVIFQGINELTICFNTISIGDKSIASHKDLGSNGSIVNSRSITEDGVSSDRLIAAFDVTSRET